MTQSNKINSNLRCLLGQVIPPGMDFSYVTAQDTEDDGDLKSLLGSDRVHRNKQLPTIWTEVKNRF